MSVRFADEESAAAVAGELARQGQPAVVREASGGRGYDVVFIAERGAPAHLGAEFLKNRLRRGERRRVRSADHGAGCRRARGPRDREAEMTASAGGPLAAFAALAGCAAAFYVGDRLSMAAPRVEGVLSVLAPLTEGAWQALPGAVLADPLALSLQTADVGCGMLLCVPVLLVWALAASVPGRARTDDAYGSERKGTLRELAGYRNRRDPRANVILSEGVAVTLGGGARKRPKNLNVCVIGGSGAGKTVSVIEPNLLQMGDKDTVSTDPKGATLPRIGGALVAAGREVVKLDLVDRASSSVWNPLSIIREYDDIGPVCKALVEGAGGGRPSADGHIWDDGAADLMKILVSYLWAWREPELLTMKNVNALLGLVSAGQGGCGFDALVDELRSGYRRAAARETTASAELAAAPPPAMEPSPLRRRAPGDPLEGVAPGPGMGWDFTVSEWDRFSGGAAETMGGFVNTLSEALAPFCGPGLQRVFGAENGGADEIGLDLLGIGDTRRDVFVVCSDKDHYLRPVLALFFWEALLASGRNADETPAKRLPHHVQLLFDELYSIGRLPDFQENIATVRSRNISMLFCVQSLAQIEEHFGEKGTEIVRDCCALQVYLAGSGASGTRKALSEEIGQATVVKGSESLQVGRSPVPSGSVSQDVVGRALWTRQELGRMDDGSALVFVGNEFVVEDRKYRLDRHPDFDPKSMYDPARGAPRGARAFDYAAYRESMRAGGGR